jgi:hypothetical protein
MNPRVILAMTPSTLIIGHVGPGCTSLIQKCGSITTKGAPRVQCLTGNIVEIMVPAMSECTHLVINYKEQGVADRDGRAAEAMRWAAANGVGK